MISCEYVELKLVVDIVQDYCQIVVDIVEVEVMMDDLDMCELVEEELFVLCEWLVIFEQDVWLVLLFKDVVDVCFVVMEI